MNTVEIIGYLAAIIMGVTLGLMGGGGSILTVPILVYLFHISPVMATAYSLFIVGITSLVGLIGYIKQGLVNYKIGLIFAIPSFIGVFSARKFIVPIIPETIISIGGYNLSKDTAILIFFSILMLFAAYSMIREKETEKSEKEMSEKIKRLLIIIEGLIVGIITGIVGAGGGFLVIPALVILTKIPMKEAVGTSIMIITIKSLIGFLGDLSSEINVNWSFLFGFSFFTITGIIIGTYSSSYVPEKKMKPVFGWFVMLMGLFIIGKEIIN